MKTESGADVFSGVCMNRGIFYSFLEENLNGSVNRIKGDMEKKRKDPLYQKQI